ncbi:hypothetical protein AGR13a_Lc30072 [Agrobacterium genomosp. 13 str. CFBP 6927]|uniref:Uncharacterized protein n=1 Tax=Agrobacterium genomosp. 13 str. CFBP 6927 TaxID=1183428 RepID=A0ABM9VL68_9HYPH|nr:hypothetical protein AGR13a_Lc30072 [Agrobacterium genomosp. 13 str. CFBP 6927]
MDYARQLAVRIGTDCHALERVRAVAGSEEHLLAG